MKDRKMFYNRPSGLELRFYDLLEEQKIEFTTHHPVVIDGKVLWPDIFITGTNWIIEVQGCWWHACPDCFPDHAAVEEVTLKDQKRIGLLEDAGFEVMIVWEHEIDDPNCRWQFAPSIDEEVIKAWLMGREF